MEEHEDSEDRETGQLPEDTGGRGPGDGDILLGWDIFNSGFGDVAVVKPAESNHRCVQYDVESDFAHARNVATKYK